MIRKTIIDEIMNDPAWNGGNCTEAPLVGLKAAMGSLFIMTSAPLVQQRAAPTRAAADSQMVAYVNRQARALDGGYILIPTSDQTRGHGTHSRPQVWHDHLAEFMKQLPDWK